MTCANDLYHYMILDWAGNVKFHGAKWISFEHAEEFLSEFLGESYDDERGEFFIIEVKI